MMTPGLPAKKLARFHVLWLQSEDDILVVCLVPIIALPAALVGAAVLPGEDTPLMVQHIVRSFDPCMAGTVH